jgi:hypothetical protein
MPEAITGAVWAFYWGMAAACGALIGAILGLMTRLRHRAIAAFMSLGAGVLLSAASSRRRHSCWPARHLQQRE